MLPIKWCCGCCPGKHLDMYIPAFPLFSSETSNTNSFFGEPDKWGRWRKAPWRVEYKLATRMYCIVHNGDVQSSLKSGFSPSSAEPWTGRRVRRFRQYWWTVTECKVRCTVQISVQFWFKGVRTENRTWIDFKFAVKYSKRRKTVGIVPANAIRAWIRISVS